jgi:DNA-binding SARP family transcriptional activator
MAELEFGLLGPLLVRSADTVMPVRQGTQRAVLASLLLNAGRPVSVDGLAQSLWGSEPRPSAPVIIRNYVMRLRHSLGPVVASRICTRPPGYLINVKAGELDVTRFRELMASGRAAAKSGSWAEAADRAGSALGLWRGEPLADVESATLALLEVPRLTEMRLQAVEVWADASLRLGRHAEVVGELERLVAAYPLREQLSVLLMLGFYHDGRAADALAVYQRARKVLDSDLGLEPGAELRELQQRILLRDSTLGGPRFGLEPVPASPRVASRQAAAVPRQLPTVVRRFAGRASELEWLSAFAAEAAEAGTAVGIAAITGTAGVGKTTLAVHWARSVADRFPDGQLYVNLRGSGPGDPVRPGEAVRVFLAALGTPGQRIPVGLDAQAGLYRSLLSGKRMLVLLDNARHADQVRPLLPGSPDCLVVVTSRSQLTGLVATEDACQLSLGPLNAGRLRRAGECRCGPGQR